MKKRLLPLLMALVLVISLIAPLQFVAAGAALSVSNATGAQGQNVTVTVSLSGNPGIWGMDLSVAFDGNVLALTSSSGGSVFDSAVMSPPANNPQTPNLTQNGMANTDKNGVLVSFTFTVSPTAAFGDYTVSASGSAININGDSVEVAASSGTVTVACNHANAGTTWEHDATNHFHICSCGATVDSAPHSGGKATCIAKAVCSVCGVEYGELNASNHTATEIRGATEATYDADGYTGDTYCTGCNAEISKGTAIPKLVSTPESVPVSSVVESSASPSVPDASSAASSRPTSSTASSRPASSAASSRPASSAASSRPASSAASSRPASSAASSTPVSSEVASSAPTSVPDTSIVVSSAPTSSQAESLPISEPATVEDCLAVIGQLLPQGVTETVFEDAQKQTEVMTQAVRAIDNFALSVMAKKEIDRPEITEQEAQVIEQTYRDAFAAANPGKTALLDVDTGISMQCDNFTGAEQATISAKALPVGDVFREAEKLVKAGETLFAYDIEIDFSVPGPKELTFRMPGLEGENVVIAHKTDSGEWETFRTTVSDDGFATITVTTLSPFVGYIDSASAVNPLFIYIGLAVVVVAGVITAVLLLRRKKSA